MSAIKGLAQRRRRRKKMIEEIRSDFDTSTGKKETMINKSGKMEGRGSRRWTLVMYEELPDYMKDNEYILRYYRANWPLKQACKSLFRWHNETLNVWTHLIGFLVFLGLTVIHLSQVPTLADLRKSFTRHSSMSSVTNASDNRQNLLAGTARSFMNLDVLSQQVPATKLSYSAERWPLYVFLGGSMFCLLSSSVCHLFSCHSHRLNVFLLRVDYSGIAVMIVASFFPPIYYIFQCDPHWQVVYLAGITIMGVLTLIILFSPALSTSKFRAFRALLFAVMGFSGIVPAVHSLVVNWTEPRRNITLAYEAGMALSYVVGTIFYVSRVPERWSPGMFDLAGHSHQIFHVFVILGALAHYGATLVFLDWRDTVGCNHRI